MIGCVPRFVSPTPNPPIPRSARFSNVCIPVGIKYRHQYRIRGEFSLLTGGSGIVGRNPEGFVANGVASNGGEQPVGVSATIIG